jgi:hypothetical protein
MVEENEAKKERHRSPNYPAVGLEDAVARVRLLVKADGKAGAPTEVAAKHIGYSSAHGSAMSTLAALKKYGLVADSAGRIIPTQRALEILNLPEADPRRKTALQDAALSPSIFRELFEQYKDTGLPGQEALEAELKTYRGFNPKAVSAFVRDFVGTLDFAGINRNGALDSSLDATKTSSEDQMSAPDVSGSPALSHGFSITFSGGTRKYPIDISIPRGLKAELAITGDLKKEDLDKLKRQIDRLMDGLADAFTD